MTKDEFALALNALLPNCDPEAADRWAEFAAACVDHAQFVYFIPVEYHDAVEKWLDATYAGLYAVKQEYGPEITARVAGLSCQRCGLYPDEMGPAARVLMDGGDAERVSGMMASGTLEMVQPYFLDLPDGAALTAQGPEVGIAQAGVPCGLLKKRTEPGYLLADGAALLESERDGFDRYRGGAGMDGMYLQTGRLYAPVRDVEGRISAFREVRPVTGRDREAAFLAAENDGFAIYHWKGANAKDCAPLARLQREGKSPLDGGYDLVHVVYTEPGPGDSNTLEACKAAGALNPGDIMVFKHGGMAACWYTDLLAFSKLPGLLGSYLKTAELSMEQNCNQIDGIINNEVPRFDELATEDAALFLVGGTTYLHVQTSEDDRGYTRDDCFTTYDYTLYDKETMGQLDGGRMEVVSDIRDDPWQIHYLAARNILECMTDLGDSPLEAVPLDLLEALQDAAMREMEERVAAAKSPKPSLRDNLKQCQQEAADRSQGGNSPDRPRPKQER